MEAKPEKRKLEKGSIFLQYDRGYNHSHGDWEKYHQQEIKKLKQTIKDLKDYIKRWNLNAPNVKMYSFVMGELNLLTMLGVIG